MTSTSASTSTSVFTQWGTPICISSSFLWSTLGTSRCLVMRTCSRSVCSLFFLYRAGWLRIWLFGRTCWGMTCDIVSTAWCSWTSRRCWICRLAFVSFINVNAQRTFFRSFGKPEIDTCNGFLVALHTHNRIVNHNLLFRKLLESLCTVLRCIENEKD